MRFSAKALGPALKLTLQSFLDNPVTMLVCLGSVVLTVFFRCVFLGCDLRMQSVWVFLRELIIPGLAIGFLLTFLWNLWRLREL